MHIFKVLPRYLILYLKSPFLKFYGRYKDVVSKNNLPLGQMLNDVFHSYCSAIWLLITELPTNVFQFPDNDKEHTVDLTVSRRCSHPHDTWSYLLFCRGPCFLWLCFVFFPLDFLILNTIFQFVTMATVLNFQS